MTSEPRVLSRRSVLATPNEKVLQVSAKEGECARLRFLALSGESLVIPIRVVFLFFFSCVAESSQMPVLWY